MTDKEKDWLRGLLWLFLIVVIVPTFLFGYPGGDVGQWWTNGQAQLSASMARAGLEAFWGDDSLGNLFKNGMTLLLANVFIPAWNSVATYQIIRYGVPIIVPAMIYDLLKSALHRLRPSEIRGEEKKQ